MLPNRFTQSATKASTCPRSPTSATYVCAMPESAVIAATVAATVS